MILKTNSLKLLFAVSIICLILSVETVQSKNENSNNAAKLTAPSEYYIFDLDRFRLPINNKGIIADVNPGNGAGGWYDGLTALYSGGFFISGYSDKDNDNILEPHEIWSSGMMTASRIEDYHPGPVGSDSAGTRNRIYSVHENDQPFSNSWIEWKDAVELGAGFYDGNSDGIYNPLDMNSNGTWDTNEDKPDIVGTVTTWCVYNDAVDPSLRRFTVDPQGIEIKQSAFVFENFDSSLRDVVFVRYSIENKGTLVPKMEEVFFAAVADPDLGGSGDDLIGCDTELQCGFTYNDGDDISFGPNPPALLVQLLEGAPEFIPGISFIDNNNDGLYTDNIDTPLDTAVIRKGKTMGINYLPGASNLSLNAHTQYMQSHPTHGDPNTQFEARNYLLGGLDKSGDPIDVCTWEFGNGSALSNCSSINPKFMYSGDPVNGEGWLNNTPIDQRSILTSGPFTLEVNKPKVFLYAYITERGTDHLNSIAKAKDKAELVKRFYESNFTSITTDVKSLNELYVEDFQLHQNYPNPFNPTTTIEYEIPGSMISETSNVKLVVLDLLGRKVKTLVDEQKTAGTYKVNFDAGNLPSGIYFYKISSGNFNQVRKMMLLK